MKAVSDKTRFYLFLLHTFLSSLIFSLQVDLTQRLFFFFHVQIQVLLSHCLQTQQGEWQSNYFSPWHLGTGYIFQALASA